MKLRLPILLLTVAGLLAGSALALPGGNNDLFWDASGSMGAIVMTAKYKESPDNGLIDQTLEVQLDNAPPNTQVFLSINGQRIGNMTTDVTGTANFRMDIFGVAPDANGRPDGPRIETGDVIRVFRGAQGIEGTFQPRP